MTCWKTFEELLDKCISVNSDGSLEEIHYGDGGYPPNEWFKNNKFIYCPFCGAKL